MVCDTSAWTVVHSSIDAVSLRVAVDTEDGGRRAGTGLFHGMLSSLKELIQEDST
jgi:hypothetical protein